MPPSPGGYWSGSTGFVIACVMAMLGAGVVLRLPMLAQDYGGLAFLLVYLVALAGFVWPVLAAEWMLGRRMRQDFAGNLHVDLKARGSTRIWLVIPALCLVVPLIIVSYYVVLAGWQLGFLVRALGDTLRETPASNLTVPFLTLAQDAERSMAWQLIFLVVCGALLSRGMRAGIELPARMLMLVMFVCLLFLLVVASSEGALRSGVALWWYWQPAELGWRGVFEALRQAMFSASLGLGVMLAFGGYLSERAPILRLAAVVVGGTAVLALLAGTVLIGLLNVHGVTHASQMEALFAGFVGYAVATDARWVPVAVYLMLTALAMASAIALMEPLVQFLMARRGMTRAMAVTSVSVAVWLLGMVTILTFGSALTSEIAGRSPFVWLQDFVEDVGIPLAVILIVIFVGRVWPRQELQSALLGQRYSPSSSAGDRGMLVLRFALVYPARVAIIAILLYGLGALDWLFLFWGLQ